jgi:hypothetical protein
VSDPSDPAHLVLRSNFGLLVTRDRGDTWDLVCEAGVGYQNIEPAIALLSDGTTIAALGNGVARGARDDCSFGVAEGVATYIADVARDPSRARGAVAVSVDFDRSSSAVWQSLDDGATWSALGTELANLNAATLDTSAGGVLYVSGVSQGETVTGVLARSEDGGKTFARYDVPFASKVSAPYIAALAPGDDDTVYVRLSGTPGRLVVTHDGGRSFRTLLELEGPFDGFALSPDGRYALASSRVDGVWRASTSDLEFERLSCAKVRCLSWTSSGLFACADEFQAGFLVGESTDLGDSFQARLHMPCVRGPLGCGADAPVGKLCDSEWPAISEKLGSDCASAGDFEPDTSCTGSGASGSSGLGGSAGGRAGSPVAGANASGTSNDGGCSVGHATARRLSWAAGLLILAAVGRRRIRELTRRRC